jgi:queuine tRNA-ribosyltransferase
MDGPKKFEFHLAHLEAGGRARAGTWSTPHGTVETPVFMPVGTVASVKGLLPSQLRQVGVGKILANTYHLALRPGPELVAELGGLHRFMAWDGPILTDSGGFQVFSLARMSKLNDEEVVFRSHLDGSLLRLSPERAMEIQELLGADCIMCLDECPPADGTWERVDAAVTRTTNWARRCRDKHSRPDQALFGIVQGGVFRDLRERSAAELLALEFPGYAIGGLSVGETPAQMYETLEWTVPLLPANKPRYLMGVGRPIDLLEAVCRGIDLFDCVLPTRNGRNAMAYTHFGPVRIRNLKYRRDDGPLDPACECPVCTTFSRAYLRHLFIANEMLGPMLLSWHNVAYYQTLMRDMRRAILADRLQDFRTEQLAAWGEGP